MKTLLEVMRLSSDYLKERGVMRARRVTEELLAHVLNKKRIELYLHYDQPLEEKELSELRSFVQRCAAGEPPEYVLGELDFYGCRLHVNRSVLIPRPETEILVDLIAKRGQGKTVWDLCTGSGCIGIALKKKRPEWDVTLSDLSEDALRLASENARLNEVDIQCLLGDLFAPFQGRKADLIVCNPPYVSQKEYLTLDRSVRDFEPKQALVGGDDGLLFYRRIAAEIGPFLGIQGQLWLEIGHTQGAVVKEIFGQEGEVIRDWSGKDRFFFLEIQSLSQLSCCSKIN